MRDRVLIVDSSLTVRMDVAEAMEDAGFAAVPCGTLQRAREELESGGVSAVVVGALFPEENRAMLVQNLKQSEHTSNIPVIVLDNRDGRSAGAAVEQYAGKAYNRDDVVARTRELMESAGCHKRRGSPRVLVIDDSPTYRQELGERLQEAGYRVLTAETGEAGLGEALSKRPDAIVVDSVLPGIDGATVLRRVRQDTLMRRTPCLLLTASEDPREELRALEAGADSFVRKDQDLDVVLACLSAAVRSAAAPPALDTRSVRTGPPKVLLVLDERDRAEELNRQLVSNGYDVLSSNDFGSVLRLLHESAADCAIVGAARPQELITMSRQIKASPSTRRVRLMVLGTAEDRALMVEAMNAGADDYVLSSSGTGVLLARLRAQIRRKQLEDENRAIRDQILRQQLEAQSQREIAETRAALAEELKAARDVAEEKAREAEQAKREAQDLARAREALLAQNQAIFSSMTEGIIICDLQGRITYVNEAARRMYRLEEMDLVGREIFDLQKVYELRYPDGSEMSKEELPIARALRGETVTSFEVVLHRRDVNYSWIASFGVTPVRNSSGEQILAALTVRDITAQKRAEEALRRSEKLAATGRLAATIAHEINNPLEAVTNLLYLLESVSENPLAQDYLATAQNELSRVTHIARQTLAFYREATRPVSMEMGQLVREVLSVYDAKLRAANLRVETELASTRQPKGFPGEMRQVISNLLVNAIDASSPGKCIRIRVHDSVDWSVPEEPGVRLAIGDSGRGIENSLRPEIFKPFVTTKGQKGTGLGLWVSNSIVGKHGGKLRYYSSPGYGTCFTVFLPEKAQIALDEVDSTASLLREVGRDLLRS